MTITDSESGLLVSGHDNGSGDCVNATAAPPTGSETESLTFVADSGGTVSAQATFTINSTAQSASNGSSAGGNSSGSSGTSGQNGSSSSPSASLICVPGNLSVADWAIASTHQSGSGLSVSVNQPITCGAIVGPIAQGQSDQSESYDFGDGTQLTKAPAVHSYTQPGTYSVLLFAFVCGDASQKCQGLADSVTVSVTGSSNAGGPSSGSSGGSSGGSSQGNTSAGNAGTNGGSSSGSNQSQPQAAGTPSTQPGSFTLKTNVVDSIRVRLDWSDSNLTGSNGAAYACVVYDLLMDGVKIADAESIPNTGNPPCSSSQALGGLMPGSSHCFQLQGVDWQNVSHVSNQSCVQTPTGTPGPYWNPAGGGSVVADCPIGRWVEGPLSQNDYLFENSVECDAGSNYIQDYGILDSLGAELNDSRDYHASINFAGGQYTFFAYTSSGMRLWVDGTLIIDSWHGAPRFIAPVQRQMSSGPHKIDLEEGGRQDMVLWLTSADIIKHELVEQFKNANLALSAATCVNGGGAAASCGAFSLSLLQSVTHGETKAFLQDANAVACVASVMAGSIPTAISFCKGPILSELEGASDPIPTQAACVVDNNLPLCISPTN